MRDRIDKKLNLMGLDHSKLQPQARDFEDKILGACISDTEAFERVKEVLEVRCFYSQSNQLIFKAISTLYDEGKPIDLVTVTQQLKQSGNLEAIGGAYHLSTLTDTMVGTSKMEHYSFIVLQQYMKRRYINMAGELGEKSYDEVTDPFEIQNELIADLDNLNSMVSRVGDQATDVTGAIDEYLEEKMELSMQDEKPEFLGIPTDSPRLNRAIGGLENGKLIILAGRPGMGKTARALNMFSHLMTQGYSGIYFSLEMSSKELAGRIISSELSIDSNKLKLGDMTQKEWVITDKLTTRIAESRCSIQDSAYLDVPKVKIDAKKHSLKHNGIDFIFIDYLQLMKTNEAYKTNQNLAIGDITRTLKNLAMEIGIPVILLSQLSRALESRQDKRPMLSDLRDSGSIEQDADVVLMEYSPKHYYNGPEQDPMFGTVLLNDNTTNAMFNLHSELIIRKNRSGEPDVTVVEYFFRECSRFQDNSNVNLHRDAAYSESGEDVFTNKITPFDPDEDKPF